MPGVRGGKRRKKCNEVSFIRGSSQQAVPKHLPLLPLPPWLQATSNAIPLNPTPTSPAGAGAMRLPMESRILSDEELAEITGYQ